MDRVFHMYLWEEINTKFQMYPFHPPRCSATHKFLARLDVHLTFVWVLTAVDFCIPKLHCIHDVSWIAPSLNVMISGFISIAEDGLLSNFNPWFKINSRPISHFFFHSSTQVHGINFHLFDVLNGVVESILGWVVFEICSCLKYSRRGSDLSYCLYLFIYLFSSHGSALF